MGLRLRGTAVALVLADTMARLLDLSRCLGKLLRALPIALAACVVSPQPSPPEDDPELLGDGISVVPDGAEDFTEILLFEATEGTVDPPRGAVIVTNLSRSEAPSRVAVRSDGSFSVALAGFPGDRVRFQVDQDGLRSDPVDITVDATGQGSGVTPDEALCFVIEPEKYLQLEGPGDARNIVLRNECGTTLGLGAPRLRRGQGPFTFSPTEPLEIPAGESRILTVRAPTLAGEDEDVLFIDIVDPEPSTHAITVHVED